MDVDVPQTETKKKDENVEPSAGEDAASKYPDMSIAQSIHKVNMMSGPEPQLLKDGIEAVKIPSNLNETVLKQIVEELENPSLYRHLVSLKWEGADVSSADLDAMEEKNRVAMKSLEEKVEEAKENSGDMEVLDARFEVARFAAKSLSKDEALGAYKEILDLPKLSSGKTMDALMESAKVASFHGDVKKNAELVEKIAKLADESGDWDRRNRLKVYNALAKILARDIKGAASLLIDCIATFSCAEMCTYTEFVMYTMISNLLHVPRTELKAKIIDGPEILAVVSEIPIVAKLANALYECNYKVYLEAMVEVQPVLIADRFLQPHCGYIMRELHVLGYKQFLDSYKSVTLKSMANSFGVGTEFLDLQLSRFIAAGRLTAKIDKFGGVVETNRPDLKNAQYRDMIQKGDLLLNRIQKLARVVDV